MNNEEIQARRHSDLLVFLDVIKSMDEENVEFIIMANAKTLIFFDKTMTEVLNYVKGIVRIIKTSQLVNKDLNKNELVLQLHSKEFEEEIKVWSESICSKVKTFKKDFEDLMS